ncbi:unnamed protein product [Closterium sp. Naga37s-1]|nr:unnamed protein product [Closterium sp. Naga37s-1]
MEPRLHPVLTLKPLELHSHVRASQRVLDNKASRNSTHLTHVFGAVCVLTQVHDYQHTSERGSGALLGLLTKVTQVLLIPLPPSAGAAPVQAARASGRTAAGPVLQGVRGATASDQPLLPIATGAMNSSRAQGAAARRLSSEEVTAAARPKQQSRIWPQPQETHCRSSPISTPPLRELGPSSLTFRRLIFPAKRSP